MAIKDLHKVIDGIVNILFAPDNRRLQAWVDRLCKMNQETRKAPVMGFLYGGVFYRPSNVQGLIVDKRAIDPSLYPQIDQFLKDKAIVDNDKAFIRQGLFCLMDPCETLQDLRDALPDCIVDCVSQLRELDRTREAAFIIQDNPRALRQFNKIFPKMEVQAAARLIY